MQVDRTLLQFGGEDGDLSRSTVGPRAEPVSPRPDRRRGLFLALVVVVVVLLLQALPTTNSGERSQGSFCDQHRGQPA